VFLNLEMAYNRVPREVLKWTMMRKEVPKMYINSIQVGGGVHQMSALRSYLSSVLIDEVSKEI